MEEFFEAVGITPSTVLIAVAIAILAVLFMRRRSRNSKQFLPAQPVVKKPAERPVTRYRKDSYDGEVSSAVLYLGGIKDKIEFQNLVATTCDTDMLTATLERDDSEAYVTLGSHDHLVVKGDAVPCDFVDVSLVRIWSGGELVSELRLADMTIDGRYVTGFDQSGADTEILVGSALTMIVE